MYATYSGVASGMAIFLVAAGLSWIFGLLKILNMAHGNFFMVGCYVAFSATAHRLDSLIGYIGAAIAAAVVVGALGYVTDRLMLRRLRNVDSHYILIGTFALSMFVEGVVKLVWGADFYSIAPPPGLDGPVQLGDMYIPRFTLFVIVAGLVVFALLEYLLHRTWTGKLLQSLANDPWMAGMLGINVPLLLTTSVVASFALAGLAGGLLLPIQSLSAGVGNSYLLMSFFAVVMGGLGNIRGAFIASLLLGLIQNLSTVALPNFPGLAVYVVLALFLVKWPNGIFPPAGTK